MIKKFFDFEFLKIFMAAYAGGILGIWCWDKFIKYFI